MHLKAMDAGDNSTIYGPDDVAGLIVITPLDRPMR